MRLPSVWLAGFEVVRLGRGETSAVRCQVTWRRFAHWAGGWQLEPGDYRLLAGFAVDDLPGSVIVSVDVAGEAAVAGAGRGAQ